MRRLSRLLLIVAVCGACIGAAAWPWSRIVAIPMVVLAAAAIVCAIFAWFRLDHLRELERLGR